MGHFNPEKKFFLKVKKCPFFWAKVPYLENEKGISWMNALFCWKESALFAVSSKDSVKAISDVIETPYFQKILFDSWTK
jgi:hypothetical protein